MKCRECGSEIVLGKSVSMRKLCVKFPESYNCGLCAGSDKRVYYCEKCGVVHYANGKLVFDDKGGKIFFDLKTEDFKVVYSVS